MSKLDKETLVALKDSGILSEEVYMRLIAQDQVTVSSSQPIKSLVEHFQTYLKDNYSKHTANGYIMNLRKFLEFHYEVNHFNEISNDEPYNNITGTDVDRWYKSLAASGYSSTTIVRFKHSVKKFLEFLGENGVNVIDIELIPLPEVDQEVSPKEIDAIRIEDVRNIARFAANKRNKLIILLLFESSMKRQELIDCKIEHIDFEHRLIKITKSDGTVDRIGKFSEETSRLLKKYIRETEIEKKGNTSEYLFQTAGNPKLSYGTIIRAIKDACNGYYYDKYISEGHSKEEAKGMAEEMAGSINTETFRHSLRAYLFSKGKDIQTIQAIMGDENRHKVRRYLKVAQVLYPEKFLE